MTSIFDIDCGNMSNEYLAGLPKHNSEFTKLFIEELSKKPGPNIVRFCLEEDMFFMLDEQMGIYELEFIGEKPNDMNNLMVQNIISHALMHRLQHQYVDDAEIRRKLNGYTIYVCNFDPFGAGSMVYTCQAVEKKLKIPMGMGHFSFYINCKYTQQSDEEKYPNLAKLIAYWNNLSNRDDSCELVKQYSTEYRKYVNTDNLE